MFSIWKKFDQHVKIFYWKMRGRVNFERFYTAKIASWIRSIFANSPLKVKLTTRAKYFDIYIKFNRKVQLKHGKQGRWDPSHRPDGKMVGQSLLTITVGVMKTAVKMDVDSVNSVDGWHRPSTLLRKFRKKWNLDLNKALNCPSVEG